MFIILRIFLPNERAWVFPWTFLLVIPTLIPSYVLSQVKTIITDNCPQKFIQIDYTRKKNSRMYDAYDAGSTYLE